jgi:hypothetical protein
MEKQKAGLSHQNKPLTPDRFHHKQLDFRNPERKRKPCGTSERGGGQEKTDNFFTQNEGF